MTELNGTNSATARLPTVRVVIVRGKNEVTIKVSDEGGGIPRSIMSRIFKFTHSTSRSEQEKDTDFGTVEAGIHMRGFGLPLARIYARYFGGELTLKSMEGYGLDAYLYLPRLGDACENLPRRVSFSPGELVSLPALKKKKQSGSAANSSSSSSTTRTFSTLIPKQAMRKPAYVAPTIEPWAMNPGDLSEEGAWEEAKLRRILRVLNHRAL